MFEEVRWTRVGNVYLPILQLTNNPSCSSLRSLCFAPLAVCDLKLLQAPNGLNIYRFLAFRLFLGVHRSPQSNRNLSPGGARDQGRDAIPRLPLAVHKFLKLGKFQRDPPRLLRPRTLRSPCSTSHKSAHRCEHVGRVCTLRHGHRERG